MARWHRPSITRLGSALLGLFVLAGPASAQTVAPAPVAPPAPAVDKAQPGVPAVPPACTDCNSPEAERPLPADTVTVTPDGKTIVPKGVMREQADFKLNDALRNMPGINRR